METRQRHGRDSLKESGGFLHFREGSRIEIVAPAGQKLVVLKAIYGPTDGSKPKIPCNDKTTHVAYILMAERNDTNGDSHNNGKYAMYITVSQPDHGPNAIREGENLNPVKTLRLRYDVWRQAQPASFR